MRLVAAAIALAGCGRIGFDPGGAGGGGGASGGDAPGGSVLSSCAAKVFADSFDGTTTGGSWFPLFGGSSGNCSVAVNGANSQMDFVFQSPSSPGCIGGLTETPAIDLNGTCTVFEIAGAPASGDDRGVVAVGTQTDFVGFEVGTTVSAVSRSASIDTELASAPFDAAGTRFLIVVHTGSHFVLGTGASAAGPFAQLATSPIGSVNVAAGGALLAATVIAGTSANGDTFAVASVSLAR